MNANKLRPPPPSPAHRSSSRAPVAPAARPTAEQHARTVWFRPSGEARRKEVVAGLYTAHHRAVQAFARRLGAGLEEAEDVCADVFVIALRRLDSFRGQSAPRTWLFGITTRVMLDRRRSATARREVLVDECPEQLECDTPEGAVAEAEVNEVLHQAVAQLPERQRRLVAGYHLQERPMAELARRQKVPLQTAYARLYAGQVRLREALEVRLA